MVNLLKNNKWLLVIFAVFIFTRFLGLGQIYHQDEYRWATIVNPVFDEGSGVHPPITRVALSLTGRVFGYDNLRVASLVFSIFNLLLIYLISLKISKNKKVALIAVGLFTVNIYSLIANLQIDIDGAILPFFILLTYYFYLNILEKDRIEKKWFVLSSLAIIGGFFTKLSFMLFIGALVADWLVRAYCSKEKNYLKNILKKKKVLPWVVGFLSLVTVLYYFYNTRSSVVIDYAKNFKSLDFASRAYFDMVFKIFKSFVWLSPLLLLPVLYGLFNKDMWKKYKIWFLYLFVNLIFYLILFDFSTLTIERYFMFLIIPSVFICAQAIYDLWERRPAAKKVYIITGAIFILLSYVVLSLPHDVLPLNPKEAYVDRIKALDFNFLIPFTGGSGPSGFYFSALFILLAWITAGVSFWGAVLAKNKSNLFLATFVVLGVGYNIIFSSEYLFGTIYGSVDRVAKETIEYVNSRDTIKRVITYYDIGAYYLRLNGKYYSRFYTAPKRDYTPKIENYRGHYMIVDFPAIDKNGRYWPLIAQCPLLKKFQDKKVESYVFDCSKI